MSPMDHTDVRVNLRKALADLEVEYTRKRQSIVAALREFGDEIPAGSPAIPHLRLAADDLAPTDVGSVGDDKLEMVRAFLRQHPEGIRQADVAPALGLNTGTVSVALRKLLLLGEAKRGLKRNGSNLWTPAQVPVAA